MGRIITIRSGGAIESVYGIMCVITMGRIVILVTGESSAFPLGIGENTCGGRSGDGIGGLTWLMNTAASHWMVA